MLLAWTALFFIDGWLRCTAKFFWFDELCTLYIAQLPTFSQSWQAVLHGADYNPPLFYVIMRAVEHTVGGGLFAFRLPAMLGVWAFCASLFYVVWRRFGLASGSAALLYPSTTIAAYYACEARPHGLVLGFIGLAIVCWELLTERPGSWGRLTALSVCLGAAFFTHCYAVLAVIPFAAAELAGSWKRGSWRPRVWIAFFVPLSAAVLSFVPLLHAYRLNLAGTGFAYQFRSGFWQLPFFYARVFAPGSLVIVTLFLTLGARQLTPRVDYVLATGFALLPVAAVMLGMAIHGPFIPRYFLSTVAGFALLIGYSATSRLSKGLLLATLILTVGRSFGTVMWHRLHGLGESLTEPVVQVTINTTPGQPLARFRALERTDSRLPIVIEEPMDFLYLVHYAPALRSRLYYVATSSAESNFHLYRNVRDWCHINYNPVTTYSEFLPGYKELYVWGDAEHLQAVGEFTRAGGHIDSWFSDGDYFLARVSAEPAAVLTPPQQPGAAPRPRYR